LAAVKTIKKALEQGKLANLAQIDLGDQYVKIAVVELSLLTMKPFLYVFNVADTSQKLPEGLEKLKHIKLDIKIEEELIEMDEAEKAEMGLVSNINSLIVVAYDLLGLMTYLTTGKDESRAWTVKKGALAPEAGAAIHTDFQEKFIRADVIMWDKLLEIGSWEKAKEQGAVKTVGKDYVMHDGEVVEFKV
jgi:hypothetical protein